MAQSAETNNNEPCTYIERYSQLINMGFDEEIAFISAQKYKNLNQAIDWISQQPVKCDTNAAFHIKIKSIDNNSITITLNLAKRTSSKKRYYLYQYGKEDHDDLCRIVVKAKKQSGSAIIDLEDITDTSFRIAVYDKEHNTSPISNILSFTTNNDGNVIQMSYEEIQENDEKHEKQCNESIINEDNASNMVASYDYSDEDDYTDMYSESIMNTEYNQYNTDEKEQSPKQDKSETLALVVYGIKCDEKSCNKTYSPQHMFICAHKDCQDDINIYCYSCFTWKHRNKRHTFDRTDKWAKCMQDFCEPDQNEFSNAKAKAKILVKICEVDKFLWHHRWSLGMVSKTLASGAITGLSMAVNGHMTIAAACGVGHSVIASGLIAGSLGCVAGPAIGTMIEAAFIWHQWKLERISTKEAWTLVGVSLASNVAAGAGYFGVMALGAAIGSPGGPIGIAIGITAGAIAAAIIFGLGTRWYLNKKLKKKFQNRHKMEIELQKAALKYFFNDEKYDVNDDTKFNDQILSKTYHRLCLLCHPDKNNGNQDEWLRLSSYYGILVGVWEKKHNKVDKIVSVNDLTEQQRSLIINSTLKYQANVSMAGDVELTGNETI